MASQNLNTVLFPDSRATVDPSEIGQTIHTEAENGDDKRRDTARLMNVPTKIAERFPPLLLSCSFPLLGARRFGSAQIPPPSRGVVGASWVKMAWSLEKCGENATEKLPAVRAAAEVHVEEAVEAIKSGKVIAVPTDTLYGFACDACSLEAVNRIYEIKGRKHTSPLAICVGDVSDIALFAATDHLPSGLFNALLPGPVTVILKRGDSSILEKSLNPGLDSIGVRVPDNNFIRAICRGSRSALALTSANLTGQPSSVSINDFEDLWEHCAYVYDGGVLPSGRAGSTIVDLTGLDKYKILRAGSAREETIAILEQHFLTEEISEIPSIVGMRKVELEGEENFDFLFTNDSARQICTIAER